MDLIILNSPPCEQVMKRSFCLENNSPTQKHSQHPILNKKKKENMENTTKETSFHYTKIVAGYNSQAAKIGLV